MSELFEKIRDMKRPEGRIYLEYGLKDDPAFLMQLTEDERLEIVRLQLDEFGEKQKKKSAGKKYAAVCAMVLIVVKTGLPEALEEFITKMEDLLFNEDANVGVLLAAYLLADGRCDEAVKVINKLKNKTSELKYHIFIEDVAEMSASELSEWIGKEENKFFLENMIMPQGNIPDAKQIIHLTHDAIINDKTDILAHSFVKVKDDYAICQGLYALCRFGLKDKVFELKCLHQSLCGLTALDPGNNQFDYYRRTKEEYAKYLGVLNAVVIAQGHTEVCDGYDFHITAGEYYFRQLNGNNSKEKIEIDSVQNAVTLSLKNIDSDSFNRKCEAYLGLVTYDWTPLIGRWIDRREKIYDSLYFPKELENLEACGFAKSFIRLLINVPDTERERLIEDFFGSNDIKKDIYSDCRFVKTFVLDQYGNQLKAFERSTIDQNGPKADVLLRLPLEDSGYYRPFVGDFVPEDINQEYHFSRIYLMAAMSKNNQTMHHLSSKAYHAFDDGYKSDGDNRRIKFNIAANYYLCLNRITNLYPFVGEEYIERNLSRTEIQTIRERYEALYKNSLLLSGNEEMITAYAELNHPWSAINRLMAGLKLQKGRGIYKDKEKIDRMRLIAKYYPVKYQVLPDVLEFCIVNQNENGYEKILERIDSIQDVGLKTCLYKMFLIGNYYSEKNERDEIRARYKKCLEELRPENEENYNRIKNNTAILLCFKAYVNPELEQKNDNDVNDLCKPKSSADMKTENLIQTKKSVNIKEIKDAIIQCLDNRELLYAKLNEAIEYEKSVNNENDRDNLKRFITGKVALKLYSQCANTLSDRVMDYSNHKEVYEFVYNMMSSDNELYSLIKAIHDLFDSTIYIYEEWTNEPEERDELKAALNSGITNIRSATIKRSVNEQKIKYEKLIQNEKKKLEDVPEFNVFILNQGDIISDKCIYGYVVNVGKREAKNITLTADFDSGIVTSEEKYLEILRGDQNASFQLCFDQRNWEEYEGKNLECTITVRGEYDNGVYSGEAIGETVCTLTVKTPTFSRNKLPLNSYNTETITHFVYNESKKDVVNDDFIGRNTETYILRNLVDGDEFIDYRSAIMYGVKRTGKSSLLHYFESYLKELKANQLNVVYATCQGMPDKNYTNPQWVFINPIFGALRTQYGDALNELQEKWYVENGMIENLYVRLPEFYRDLKEITGKGLFLIIDESDLLFSRPDSAMIKEMFSTMVSTASCASCVHFLICGSNMTIRYRKEAGSKDQMFQRFGEDQIIKVGQLPFDDMKEVLREPCKKVPNLKFTSEAEKKMWDYTGGLVWITKCFAYRIIKKVFEGGRSIIYPSDVSGQIGGIANDDYCSQFYEGCRGSQDKDSKTTEMIVIDAMQTIANAPVEYITNSEIKSLLEKYDLYPGDAEYNRAIDMLLELKVIEYHLLDLNRYKFSIDIMRRFFRTKKDVSEFKADFKKEERDLFYK